MTGRSGTAGAGADLVYVVGASRSGTTLIGEYLGSFDGVTTTGELNNTWRTILRGQRCSCRHTPHTCPVWGTVLDGMAAGDVEELEALRTRIERQRFLPRFLLLRHVAPERWPADVREYVSQLRSQADVVGRVTGAKVLVDTSKSATGLALALLAWPELTVLHVVRDPRAVAHSQSRHEHVATEVSVDVPRTRTSASSADYWVAANLEGLVIGHLARRYVRFVYEDLATDPRSRLERLAAALGLPGTPPAWDGDVVTLREQHVLAGNPNRTESRARPVRISRRWAADLPAGQRRSVSARALPLYRLLARSR